MAASTAPLPLFAHASRKYVEHQLKGADAEVSLRQARNVFGEPAASSKGGTDLPDPYIEQLFGDFDQMIAQVGGAFAQAALRLYGPMLEAVQQT